ELAAGSIIGGGPFSAFWFRDIFRCADWPGCESVPARSSEFRSLPVRSPSWDCWLENGIVARRDRTRFARPVHNRADPSETQAWRSLQPYRDLPPVICKREFCFQTQPATLLGQSKPDAFPLPRNLPESRRQPTPAIPT